MLQIDTFDAFLRDQGLYFSGVFQTRSQMAKDLGHDRKWQASARSDDGYFTCAVGDTAEDALLALAISVDFPDPPAALMSARLRRSLGQVEEALQKLFPSEGGL